MEVGENDSGSEVFEESRVEMARSHGLPRTVRADSSLSSRKSSCNMGKSRLWVLNMIGVLVSGATILRPTGAIGGSKSEQDHRGVEAAQQPCIRV